MSKPARKSRWLPVAAMGVFVLVAGSGAFSLIRHFLNSAPAAQKKVAQEIHIIRPPPPPPDLPPPPPPPPEEEKINEPPPDPTPTNDPPPGEQLGLDAQGSAGADGFGLAARPGGRDLLAGGGSAFAWYAGLLKNEILDRLQDDKDARAGAYSVSVKAWVRTDGSIERIQLAESTGDARRDRAIEQRLSGIKRMAQAPPADMPQPMTLRIVSRA